jgi:hypothetical protein
MEPSKTPCFEESGASVADCQSSQSIRMEPNAAECLRSPARCTGAAPESDPLKAEVDAAWLRLTQAQRQHFAAAMKAAAEA